MTPRKRKRKFRTSRQPRPVTSLETYRRIRLTWTRNPATQRIESAKRYRRSRRKKETRGEIQQTGED